MLTFYGNISTLLLWLLQFPIFPAELIRAIRQSTLLLEWMCQQVTLVSILQDSDSELMFLVVKTHSMYHRYDYLLVIFLAILDAITSVISACIVVDLNVVPTAQFTRDVVVTELVPIVVQQSKITPVQIVIQV